MNQVVQRYRFEISRRDEYSSSGGFYIETFWKEREVFEGEKELGFSKVQVKLILTSKAERGKSDQISIANVVYDVDSEIRQQGFNQTTNEYEDFSFTTDGKDYAKGILNALKDFIESSFMR